MQNTFRSKAFFYVLQQSQFEDKCIEHRKVLAQYFSHAPYKNKNLTVESE